MTVDPAVVGLLQQLRTQAINATTPEETQTYLDQAHALLRELGTQTWDPYPWQHPHRHPEGWVSEVAPGICDPRCLSIPETPITTLGWFLLFGGRGVGKSAGLAHYLDEHVKGPPCDTRVPGGHRMILLGPTQGDALEVALGPSGIKTTNPEVRIVGGKTQIAYWPNGARLRLLGGNSPEDVERCRAAGNVCVVAFEEVAAIRYLKDVLDIITPGVRLGDHPHFIGATTPKARKEIRDLIESPDTILTKGRTRDARHLSADVRAKWEERYGGTRVGRQELDGELLEDVEGALWSNALIEAHRIHDPTTVSWRTHNPDLPTISAPLVMERTLVAVDPSGGGKDSTGIVVVGAIGQHGYVLADLTTPPGTGPDQWAGIALDAYRDYGCEGIAAEHTFGGNMVTDVLKTRDPTVPIFKVPTKVGKRLRAEPVQALSEQGRLHVVGVLPDLEAEMTTWVPGESTDSPDRLDAMVHGVTYLLVRGGGATAVSPRRPGGGRVSRRGVGR